MNTHFEDFPHPGAEVSAYIFCIDTFIISLRSQQVVRYVAADAGAFRQWLDAHHARDISKEVGSMVYNYYFEEEG